ncbi:MAG: nuclear transport factor 2 family protein [Acidobacteriia bacterium]|nr:nuclear transport factor 2 family protein [Terriglobia bacterium]
MIRNQWAKLAIAGMAFLLTVSASAQQGKWAAADDPSAKSIIDMERQWAEEPCDHNLIAENILADDFQGTSTDGKRYSKAEEVEDAKHPKSEARACRLIDAKVRFFGDNVALVYGSESRIKKAQDGKEYTQTQIWTDTWLKRNGKWQIVAAQDMRTDCK